MLINRAVLGALEAGFHIITVQNLMLPDQMPMVRSIANVVTSKNRLEQYNWMVRLGRVREWIGERILRRFKAYSYIIENKKWEDSVEVERDDIMDDALGQYVPLIQAMAQGMNNHYPRLITALLETGFVNLAYDGQPFFDTAHPVGDGELGIDIVLINNMNTFELSAHGLELAFTNIDNLRNDQGEPLGIAYDTLYVGFSRFLDAKEIIEREFIVVAGAIVGYNRVRNIVRRIIFLHYLSDQAMWFLADTSRVIKPLILQIRERPIFQSVTNLNDSGVFDTDRFKFGIQGRHNAGYNLWQLAYGSTGVTPPP